MAAETRGVFTLKTVRNNILNDEYVTPDQAFFSDLRGFDTGYFGGGNPGPLSTMDRTTYSTDTTTVVPGAALSVARYGLAATGSQSAGYFGGGGGGAINQNSGAGGDGIFKLRYYGSPKATGGTITESGGYTYHTFTASGTFTY